MQSFIYTEKYQHSAAAENVEKAPRERINIWLPISGFGV